MHVGVIGATGNIGRRVVDEAIHRGHRVRAFTRDLNRATSTSPSVDWSVIEVHDPDAVEAALGGLDVVVSSYQPGNAAVDLHDALHRTIDDPSAFVRAAGVEQQRIAIEQAREDGRQRGNYGWAFESIGAGIDNRTLRHDWPRFNCSRSLHS